MKEQLFRISMMHKKTGKNLSLQIWAKNVDEATEKLAGILFGYNQEYVWTGSGPEHENNKVITREIN